MWHGDGCYRNSFLGIEIRSDLLLNSAGSSVSLRAAPCVSWPVHVWICRSEAEERWGGEIQNLFASLGPSAAKSSVLGVGGFAALL